jgi:hypothetical protein
MELSITELEPIPENMAPIKVIKKGVHFEEPEKPMHQTIPRSAAKIRRPVVVPPKPSMSYEDILSKMGMFVADGRLHLLDENHAQSSNRSVSKQQPVQNVQKPKYEANPNIPKDSYIYNKYFSDVNIIPNPIRKPVNLLEYRNMLINDILQKSRIKQIKSTKLMMPHSNINLAAGTSSNLNKLFDFSKR